MNTILKDCIITHKDSYLLKSYDVMMGSSSYHVGVDIEASEVYSPCRGVCIYSGLVDNKLSCTVQYSSNICLRFTNLSEVSVEAGQIIYYDQLIGIADKYVHFEYLTSEKNEPNFRVFFNSNISYYMYKHDPMLVLTGNIQFDNTSASQTYISNMQALYEDGKEPGE